MKKIIEKYKLSLLIALSIILIGLIIAVIINLISDKRQLKTYENDYYSLKYDNSWTLKKKQKNKIILRHSKKANINIEIIELQDESKYSEVEDLIDEVIYNIDTQNTNYKLISKKDTTLSKYNFKGYKLLYENDNSQVMVSLYKKSDKLIMFNYESNNKYFDILLDSVHNIIYNFDIKEKVYDLSSKIKIDTEKISYESDDEVDKTFNDTKIYEIASNNYYVKYSVPSSFEQSDFQSNRNYFNYKGIAGKYITINTNIYKYNIFEYLDKDKSGNIYEKNKTYKEKEEYSNFKETLTKIDGKVDTYLYKNSYTYTKNNRKDENAYLIYALNKNHILIIEIKTMGASITQKLIDSIKIEEIKNYSSYVPVVKENGYITSELKRYDGYDKKKITQVKLSIPEKYTPYEKYNDNIYTNRYFGLNYDKDKNIYDYEIHYELTIPSTKIDDKVKSINSLFTKTYGKCDYLTHLNKITKNNVKFDVYSGGYTQLGGIMFTNINRFHYYTNKEVLFYELKTGGYLVIEISGNGKEITDQIINDATNFQIEEIDN